MSKEARAFENKETEEQRREAQFEGLEQRIEKLRPEIEALAHEIETLEKKKGTVYVKKILSKVLMPALTSLAAIGGGSLLASMEQLGVGVALSAGLVAYASAWASLIAVGEGRVGLKAAKREAAEVLDGIGSEQFHAELEMTSKLQDLEHAITVARAITTRELIEGGATREVFWTDDGSKRKELRATEGQIERAREEMNKAFEKDKEA